MDPPLILQRDNEALSGRLSWLIQANHRINETLDFETVSRASWTAHGPHRAQYGVIRYSKPTLICSNLTTEGWAGVAVDASPTTAGVAGLRRSPRPDTGKLKPAQLLKFTAAL